MLNTLDILIGFTLVMLVLSMAVTMLAQVGISSFNLRGVALRHALADLLALLDRGLKPREAHTIANHILRNPLVGPAGLLSKRRCLASAIHREELVKLLLDFAAGGEAEKATDPKQGGVDVDLASAKNVANAKAVLKASLERNGIGNPEAVLKAVRDKVLELEQDSPQLANDVRANAAILANAKSAFLGKLHEWFDQSMDRATDLFTARARIVTVSVALLVAFTVQLDSLALINRLSIDNDLRKTLVSAAIARSAQPLDKGVPAAAGATTVAQLRDLAQSDDTRQLLALDVVEMPRSFDAWRERWASNDYLSHLVGVILTVALLSLGAPFWYELLKNMVNLRSIIAQKDDAQRQERQTTQTA